MLHVVRFLWRWQDLLGAGIAGSLGITGAMIVARNARMRERRNASRMLRGELLNVGSMAEAALGTFNPAQRAPEYLLASKLGENFHELSPLFDVHRAVLSGVDETTAGLLLAFRTIYQAIERTVRAVSERRAGSVNPTPEALRALRDNLKLVADYANAAGYRVELFEVGLIHRTGRRMYRRVRYPRYVQEMRELTVRLMTADPKAAQQSESPQPDPRAK